VPPVSQIATGVAMQRADDNRHRNPHMQERECAAERTSVSGRVARGRQEWQWLVHLEVCGLQP
jgi:hypothetical protein